jgi:hypothetical protein
MAATEIVTRQIKDGAITAAKIPAGANIETSKLADGANFLKRDGSVALTGNLDAGAQKVVNLGTPTANGDAATKIYVDGLIASLSSLFDSKPSARAATTGNINLSNPGTASFDTVTLLVNEILFVRAQTAAAENGLYKFNGSAVALTRIPEMDVWAEIPGALFTIEEGSTYADTVWLCTANSGGTLGTTSITFQNINVAAGLSNSNFADKETPTGAVNGSNTAFTLANTPVAGSEHIYLNGVLQESGAGNDYTITGASITMLTAPLTGEKIRVSYRK